MWSRAEPVTASPRERQTAASSGDHLGPADVIEVGPGAVKVVLSGGRTVTAGMALAVPYVPVVGDSLLVIGKGDAHYVIGVIRGKGRTSLSLEGDVDLHAQGGALRLSGDKGVRIEGPEVAIETRRLGVIAGALVEHFSSVVRRVKGLLSVQAGDSHTIADGTILSQSKSATILAEEAVTVNGKQVHLG